MKYVSQWEFRNFTFNCWGKGACHPASNYNNVIIAVQKLCDMPVSDNFHEMLFLVTTNNMILKGMESLNFNTI